MATLLLRGVPIGTIQGVLFDKDGTLSHSEPLLLDLAERRIQIAEELWNCQAPSPTKVNTLRPVLRRAFGIQGEQLHPGGTLAVAARQDNLTTMATVFCLHGCSWPSAIALAQSCFDQCDQQEHDRNSISPLLDGAEDLLRSLHSLGITNAIISNDTRAGIHAFLQHHGLSHLIAACWSADDSPRKPDPAAVLSLCTRLGLDPEECALIGDAETDLQMAAAAGIRFVIGYGGGWGLTPELPSATHWLDNWAEMELEADP